MRCRADGRLQHHFWSEYRASMVLLFDSPLMLDAILAAGKFKGWERSKKKPETVLHWFGSGDELDAEVEMLVSYGAKREKIASIAKSIDYGEPFEVELEVVDPRQISLF
jgi:uncharacterized protein YbbC (DUF1343 family)